MEVKKATCVQEMISAHLDLFLKLDRLGLKTINSAIDYLTIWEEYQKYEWIEDVSTRKQTVALKCKVSVRSVERSLYLMKQKV